MWVRTREGGWLGGKRESYQADLNQHVPIELSDHFVSVCSCTKASASFMGVFWREQVVRRRVKNVCALFEERTHVFLSISDIW